MQKKTTTTAKAKKPEAEIVPEKDRPVNARCDECLFGRCVTVCEARHGNAVQTIEKCECHMARPTKLGFPLVRRDDWCSLHVDCYTGDRTFGGVAAQNFQ